jgi:hypothetical protein
MAGLLLPATDYYLEQMPFLSLLALGAIIFIVAPWFIAAIPALVGGIFGAKGALLAGVVGFAVIMKLIGLV